MFQIEFKLGAQPDMYSNTVYPTLTGTNMPTGLRHLNPGATLPGTIMQTPPGWPYDLLIIHVPRANQIDGVPDGDNMLNGLPAQVIDDLPFD